MTDAKRQHYAQRESPCNPNMNIAPERLTSFVTEIFVSCGTVEAAARTVAEHLVEANLKGHDSHGVGMVPAYVRNIGRELLKPAARVEIVRDNGAVLLLEAGFGFGQVVGKEATELAIERARSTGVVCTGLRNAHHLGRIGSYGEQCARAGLISIHFVNVVGHEPQVSPWGGREPRMTTNPFCCVVPVPGGEPIVLDMATSAIALGKVRVAAMKGERLPDAVLLDAEGHPSDDPAVLFRPPVGSLGPFGRHKGYGLAVMCELLGGALAGHWTAQPEHARPGNIVNHMLTFVLDPAAFGDSDAFHDEVRAMVAYLHSTTPAAGVDRVRVPGEPEREAQREREAGIPIDPNSWNGIVEAAKAAGLSEARIAEFTT
jgi:hydroxycarboxylate dehydrogenase B